MCRQLDAMMTDWILNVWLSDESNVYLSTRVNRTLHFWGTWLSEYLPSYSPSRVFVGEKNFTPKQKIILSLFFCLDILNGILAIE